MSDNPETLSFEEAMAELESIIHKMDSGAAGLADSVALYERGAALKIRLESMLADAKMKVEKIQISPSGAPAAVPLDVE